MNKLISKSVLFFFCAFLGYINPSYAKSPLSYFKQAANKCALIFTNKVNEVKQVHIFISRLDDIIEYVERKRHWEVNQALVLLTDLHAFRKDVKKSLLVQKSSLSNMQKQLNRLLLSWLLWRSTELHLAHWATGHDPNMILQKWVESVLGRSLNEQELQVLEKAYRYKHNVVPIQYFTRQKILKEAGFSEAELDQLGWKTILIRGKRTVTLEMPQRVSIENRLKARGYSSAYTRGMDEIQELMVVGEQLRKQKVDPYRTHIPYLGNKLRKYIAFMELGVENATQKEHFDLLKKYVELIIQEESFTYAQWLEISLWLPDILSSPRTFPINTDNLVEHFPKQIAIPTTVGIIGFIPLNIMRSNRFNPFGLVNKPTWVDGGEIEPAGVSRHDGEHIWASDGAVKWFYDKWDKRRDTVSVKQGQNVELAYYILTHQTYSNPVEGAKRTTFPDHPPETIKEHIKHGIHVLYREAGASEESAIENLKGMIDLSGSYYPKNHPNIQAVVNDFMEVFNEIQKDRKFCRVNKILCR